MTEEEHPYYRRDLIECPLCNGSGKVPRPSCEDDLLVDAELEAPPDGIRGDALEAAAVRFFDELILVGSYAISQNELIRHEATADEMALDAEALGIPVGKLIPALQELFGLEKEYALRKAAVLRKYRSGKR